MRRIYLKNIELGTQALDKENMNYLKKVLRLSNNTEIILFDGKHEAMGVYQENKIEIKQIIRQAENESKLQIAIGQIKPARLEWLIEKATEIGVTDIFLLQTKFTQKQNIKHDRLEKIAIEGAKQSNRITIPKIHKTTTLDQFINEHKNENWYFGNLNENIKNKKLENDSNIQNDKPSGIVIGPEGGFEENESEKLFNHFIPLCLSKNILRAETAALVGLIYIQGSFTIQ